MKKTISFLLCAVLALSLFTGTAFAAESLDNFTRVNTYKNGAFSDVSAGSWFNENVKNAYELGLMQGKAAGYFGAGDSVSIAETVAMAARIHSIYYTGAAEFTEGSPWYAVYYSYAVENGIISDRQYLDYTALASRYDFAYILSKALPGSALAAKNYIAAGAIPDVVYESSGHIYSLYRAGILTGKDSSGAFAPWDNISRGEVAAIVSRMALPSLRMDFTLEEGGGSAGDSALEKNIRSAFSAVQEARKMLALAQAEALKSGGGDPATVLLALSRAMDYTGKAVGFSELALENTDDAEISGFLENAILLCREAASAIQKKPNNFYTATDEYLGLAAENLAKAMQGA